MVLHRLAISFVAAVLALVSGVAPAKAQFELQWGGTPARLGGLRSVSLQSEDVRLEMRKDIVVANATYVLRNDGGAGAVRIGVPEWQMLGSGASEPDVDLKPGPVKVSVDGVPVRTRTGKRVDSGGLHLFQRAFSLSFKARQTHTVRCSYTTSTSVSAGDSWANSTWIEEAAYSLRFGATWSGPIRRSTIVFEFKRKRPVLPIRAVPAASKEAYANDRKKAALLSHTVFYAGLGKPVLRGKTLTFSRSRWKPTPKNELFVTVLVKELGE